MTTHKDETELGEQACLLPTWHGPHEWWYTASGGGHMLSGEPTEEDWKREKGLTKWRCPGKGSSVHAPAPAAVAATAAAPEPDSEIAFAAYDKGYKLGRKHMAELFAERLTDESGTIPLEVLEQVRELFTEAGVRFS